MGTTACIDGGVGATPRQRFEALYIRWSRLHELLEAGVVAPGAEAHLARTRDVLASRLLELDPRWVPPVLRHGVPRLAA